MVEVINSLDLLPSKNEIEKQGIMVFWNVHYMGISMQKHDHDTHVCLLNLFQRHGINMELAPFAIITASTLRRRLSTRFYNTTMGTSAYSATRALVLVELVAQNHLVGIQQQYLAMLSTQLAQFCTTASVLLASLASTTLSASLLIARLEKYTSNPAWMQGLPSPIFTLLLKPRRSPGKHKASHVWYRGWGWPLTVSGDIQAPPCGILLPEAVPGRM